MTTFKPLILKSCYHERMERLPTIVHSRNTVLTFEINKQSVHRLKEYDIVPLSRELMTIPTTLAQSKQNRVGKEKTRMGTSGRLAYMVASIHGESATI